MRFENESETAEHSGQQYGGFEITNKSAVSFFEKLSYGGGIKVALF